MIRGILLLGQLGVFAEGAQREGPSEFYVVSFADKPNWQSEPVKPLRTGDLNQAPSIQIQLA
jgi:hypothetical protein